MLPFRSGLSLRLAYLWELHLILCTRCPSKDVKWLLAAAAGLGVMVMTGRYRYSGSYMFSLAGLICSGLRFAVPALLGMTLMLCMLCPVWRLQGMRMSTGYACGFCWDRMDRLKQGHADVGAFGALDFLLTRWCPGQLRGFFALCHLAAGDSLCMLALWVAVGLSSI